MMKTLEIFFDYACPYCYHGLEYLRELLPEIPGVALLWVPCEAHPRPEEYGVHSDAAVKGFYFAKENGFDAWRYNDRIFRAIFEERVNIEAIETIADLLTGLGLDGNAFLAKSEEYAGIPRKNNRLAWGENSLDAVPSYRMGTRLLKSKNGIGVTKEQLKKFLVRAPI